MEERYQLQQEPWANFVIEFPTIAKRVVQGREESQQILFLCPRAEANPSELCLALFGSQILMRRLPEGNDAESLDAVSFLFVYAAETPAALPAALAPFENRTQAPVLVARRDNVVRTAHFVTEFLTRVQPLSTAAASGLLANGTAEDSTRLDPALANIPGNEQLWQDSLPDIALKADHGEMVHAAGALQDYRAEYACRFVLAHYNENINRDKMAKMVSLSPGYFSNLFRSEVGMSFSDYLIQVRVENAKCLLKRFDLSVEDISKKCGFNSLAHFSRTFKDRCGLSPLKFRKSPHNGP